MSALELEAVATQFARGQLVRSVKPYGAGNVNDTYLVTVYPRENQVTDTQFVLQRVNTHIFRQPELILLNMRRFLAHIEQQPTDPGKAKTTSSQPLNNGRRWQMPHIIETLHHKDWWRDGNGGFWRAISMIEGAKTYPQIHDLDHAYESGYALGRFHKLLSDLDVDQLHDTLPGFHVTPQYLNEYDRVLTQATSHSRLDARTLGISVQETMNFVAARRSWVSLLEDAHVAGDLQLRSIHGDPKVDNILIDDKSGQAVSIIDLDTVKPGLVHYDIGDCLRSCCNPAGEETIDLTAVTFDTELCQAILRGYLVEAAEFFTDADYAYIYDSIRLITFELGLRFFTDFLAGDPYFKTRHPQHNLQRALVQFQLLSSIEAQETEIRRIAQKA